MAYEMRDIINLLINLNWLIWFVQKSKDDLKKLSNELQNVLEQLKKLKLETLDKDVKRAIRKRLLTLMNLILGE